MENNDLEFADVWELSSKLHNDLPILFMDKSKILNKVSLWRTNLPDVQLSYAVKANSDPLIVELLANQQCSFDVASAYEMNLVSKFHVDGSRMVLSHPVKTQRTLEAMKVHRPWAFSVDSIEELDRIAESDVLTHDYRPLLFVRISTPFNNTQDNLSAKFGCEPAYVRAIIRSAQRRGIDKFGISFHVGTQCYDVDNYLSALSLASSVAQECAQEWNVDFEWIDIGGGFADEQLMRTGQMNHAQMFRTIANEISALKSKYGYSFIGEPGRFVVADAGVLAVTVLSTDKDGARGARLILSDHLYGSFNGQEFDSRHYEPILLKKEKAGKLVQCDTFGCTCDSVDRLRGQTTPYWYVPNSVKVGDVFLFRRMGAYSVTSGASFNGIDPAGVVLMWRDENGQLQWKKSPFFDRGSILLDALP